MLMKPCNRFFQKRKVMLGIPPMIARKLAMFIGNEGHLIRMNSYYQFDKVLRWKSFNVEFSNYYRFDIKDILSPDMPFIRARVNGDPLRTEPLTIDCCFNDIRNIASPRIPQCCYFIYIYTKSGHFIKFEAASYYFAGDLKNFNC